MQRPDFRTPRDPRDKTTPFPKISIVREKDPGLSSNAKFLIGGAILAALVGGRLLMGGAEPEPVQRAPQKRVVAPGATAAPVQPAAQPTPQPIAPAKKDEPQTPARPRGLAMTDSMRLRDAALEDISRFEKAGRFQEALDALDEAEQNGADKKQFEPFRVRFRALAAEAKKLDDAFAAADHALSNGEHDAALRALEAVLEVAKKLDRSSDLDDRRRTVTNAKDRSAKLQQGTKTLARAQELLDSGDIVSARAELEKARLLVPGSQDLVRLETRIHDLERLPAGCVYVVIDADRALYVCKSPVTNAEFKKWVDASGRTGAAPWKDAFPAAEADQPVKGVFLDAAKTFAASRGERLPVEDEWPAIKKALKLAEESKCQAGVFAKGFYNVKAP